MAIENLPPEVSEADSKRSMDFIDYKNVGFLLKSLSEGGRIIPSRLSNTPFKLQRKKRIAIMRARFLALLPFVRK